MIVDRPRPTAEHLPTPGVAARLRARTETRAEKGTLILETAAAILAGGDASRYAGTPKGAITVSPGLTILERAIGEVARAGVEATAIIANDPTPYRETAHTFGCPIIPDLRQGLGPVAGIEAALSYWSERANAVLFLPCDLPAIGTSEIAALLSAFRGERGSAACAVVAETDDGFRHPLCAVARTDTLDVVTRFLDEGKRSAGHLWRELAAKPVRFDDPSPFFNVNQPEDMALYQG